MPCVSWSVLYARATAATTSTSGSTNISLLSSMMSVMSALSSTSRFPEFEVEHCTSYDRQAQETGYDTSCDRRGLVGLVSDHDVVVRLGCAGAG